MSQNGTTESQGTFESVKGLARNPLAMGAMGLVIGFVFAWFTIVWPLTRQLAAREKSLEEWARTNREEQGAVSKIKTLSTDELRKWVATLNEQNIRYAEIQRNLHRQELALSSPAYGFVFTAAAAVLASWVFFWLITRESNADAMRTLENAAAVLPNLRKTLQAEGKGQAAEPIGVPAGSIAAERPAIAGHEEASGTIACTEAALLIGHQAAIAGHEEASGTIASYKLERAFGYISPHDGGEDVFFHRNEVCFEPEVDIKPGILVTFHYGVDKKGRTCAKDVRLEQ